MSNLEQALIDSGQAVDEKDANDIVRQMVIRTKDFEEPADILSEYGFDEDGDGDYSDEDIEQFQEDIIEWKMYNPARGRGDNPNNNDRNQSPTQSGSNSADEQKMMFKIKALLDKAASSDSQQESDAFMMKAQELIQKNNLEYSRIVAVKGEKKNGVIVDEAILEEIVKYDDAWDRELMKNIAIGNMCKILFNISESKIHIIGKAGNCNSVLMLCEFYRKAILNLAIEAAKRKTRLSKTLLGLKPKAKDLMRIEKEEAVNINDYLFGAVAGLNDALTKKVELFSLESFDKEDGTGESITGMEVMRFNENKIDKYIREKYPRLGRAHFGNGGGNSDSSSYSRGYSDGGGLGASQKRLG